MIDAKLEKKFDEAEKLIKKLRYKIEKLTKHGYRFIGAGAGEGAYLKKGIVIKTAYISTGPTPNKEHLAPTRIIKQHENRCTTMVQVFCKKAKRTKKRIAEESRIKSHYTGWSDFYIDKNMGIYNNKLCIYDW